MHIKRICPVFLQRIKLAQISVVRVCGIRTIFYRPPKASQPTQSEKKNEHVLCVPRLMSFAPYLGYPKLNLVALLVRLPRRLGGGYLVQGHQRRHGEGRRCEGSDHRFVCSLKK